MQRNLTTLLFRAGMLLTASQCCARGHTNVTAEQARDLISSTDGLIVVDVREVSEYCDVIGHIPGAVNYPWNSGQFQVLYGELPADSPILIVCRSGRRSDLAANLLDSNGYSLVYDMEGGMTAWLWETALCDDLQRIDILYTRDYVHGIPPLLSWSFEVHMDWLDGVGIDHVDITLPNGITEYTVLAEDDSAHYEAPTGYASLFAVQADYPEGPYTLDFRDSLNGLVRTVSLGFFDLPGEPAGPVDFTYPSSEDATGVGPNPTFTWDVSSTAGDALVLRLDDNTAGTVAYASGPDRMTVTAWTPGLLVGGHSYELSVAVYRVKDADGPAWPTMDVAGDEFVYSLGTRFDNKIHFTTSLFTPVYRFWSPVHSRHFFTTRDTERDKLIQDYAHIWTFEGRAYYALQDGGEPNSLAVYRFWSGPRNAHFYTISEREKNKLIDEYFHIWTYEGIAFHAYPEGREPSGTTPVHRFWSDALAGHFYTTDANEKNKLINTYSHVWTYEGIAWYAYE